MTSGRLVIVGTPIGNLGDLSPRAIEMLGSADAIACEDTRRTGKLCSTLGIDRGPFLVLNEHTEVAQADSIIERIAAGSVIALVSDAGMPGVSDPGERLVRAVLEAGLDLDVVPGPTAMTTALVLSGLPVDRFVFEGFLPRKGRERAERLTELAAEPRTIVVYESPHRVVATLGDLAAVCGPERPVAVTRELTKLHQSVVRGSLSEMAQHFADRGAKGEFVVVVGGRSQRAVSYDDDALRDLLDRATDRGLSTRDAVAEVVGETGARKRRVFDLANRPPQVDPGLGGRSLD